MPRAPGDTYYKGFQIKDMTRRQLEAALDKFVRADDAKRLARERNPRK